MRRQVFVGEVPEYSIFVGVVHAVCRDEEWCFSIRAFRMAVAKAQSVLDEYDGKNATVVQFLARPPGHAALS